jgi:hypothetical protein
VQRSERAQHGRHAVPAPKGVEWPWDTLQNQYDCGRPIVAAISRYRTNPEDLGFLVDQGCRLSSAATAQAAGLGLLDCLYYLHQHGCACAENAVAQAAVGGHIDCIAFLLQHVCVLTSDAALRATTSGNVDRLRWLLARSCPLSHESAYQAALRGDFDCLRCLLQHECPILPPGFPQHSGSYDDHPAFAAAWKGHVECVRLLFDHGHRLALNGWQLRWITNETCRRLLEEPSGDERDNVIARLPLPQRTYSNACCGGPYR